MNSDKISIHGLYRSGTNYTRKLISINTTLVVLDKNLYNVHQYTDYIYHMKSRKILVYKKLNQWLESISRRCYDLECYENVHWETGHTPLESFAGVADEHFSGKHKTILSVEKLTDLYYSYMKKMCVCESYLYNDILKDPEYFLKSLKIPLKESLTLQFNKVDSSDIIDQNTLYHRYIVQ
jgi:energy-coupling factor transporter ATP-binding protein EcfA2